MKIEEKKLPYSKSSKLPKISVTESKSEQGTYNFYEKYSVWDNSDS